MEEVYDIAIIGAGPAGATCALALRASGLRVALLDAAAFPRDKVCGDAIPARAVRVLHEVAPEAATKLALFPRKTTIRACKVIAPNGNQFTYQFETSGYCMRRLDFDALLLEAVLAQGKVDFFPESKVTSLHQTEGIWEISTSRRSFHAKLVIGCDGANGVTARQLGQFVLDAKHHCAAVRAYYGGVAGLAADTMEIHLLQGWLPGYCWIFPLGEGECNVGFGMLSHEVAARKVALRPALGEMIAATPALADRFVGATLQGNVQGFGLPLGSRRVTMAGEGFLLCGDAASLIDPATGEGIGNAMWSAQIAARWAAEALNRADCSKLFLEGYSRELQRKLSGEMRSKYWAQRLLAGRPWLLNWMIGRAGKGGLVNWLARKIF